MEESLHDWYARIYHSKESPAEVTFQLTEACNLACTYCYQIAKTPKVMKWKTAKKIVDFLFELSGTDNQSCVNSKTPWIILDFIGGEPLLQIELMNKICYYFWEKAIRLNHRWATNFSISISSNGVLYFDPRFQEFLKVFDKHISFNVSIDGDQEAHDACRIYPDGCGSYCDAIKAQEHYAKYHFNQKSTKATIARANLNYIDRIIKYFASEGYDTINANTVYEEDWNINDAQLYYKKLKEIADFNLQLDTPVTITLFNETFFKQRAEDDTNTWCGGYTSMLAFDTEGKAYPCVRYMPTSLGSDVKPIVIGDCFKGLYRTPQQKDIFNVMKNITWKTQNTQECIDCPISTGCADCAAESYQRCGKLGVRNMSSCIMHKARSLANVYYWNTLYRKQNQAKRFKMYLPKDEAIEIIGVKEYNLLVKLVS